MVSEKKKLELEEIKEMIKKYPVIGMIDLFKFPSKQLQSLKKSLRGKAMIKMYKKRVMILGLKDSKRKNIEKLIDLNAKKPTLIMTDMEPFKLFRILKENKSPTYARPDDIATKDITVPAGPTSLPAGPAIGELQRAKIPAMVQEGKIHVKKDTIIVKKGDVIDSKISNVLKKLNIQPMEIGINLLGVWENETVFEKDVLDVNVDDYIEKMKNAYTHALNLAVNACYPNKESIKLLLQKAYKNAKSVGINAGILEKGVIKDLIGKANVQAKSLKTSAKK